MAGAIAMFHLALVETLMKALQGVGQATTPTISLTRFFGRPGSPCDPTIDEWLADFDVLVRQCCVPERERAVVLVEYLGGCAKEEVLCHPDEVRRDFGALVSLLRRIFGPLETVASLYAEFYSRMQSEGETLAEYGRALIRLHQRIEGAAPTMAERQALAVPGDGALNHQFVVGVRDGWVRHQLRWLVLRSPDRPFIVVREEALCLVCEEEASVVEMRPVEMAAPALSGPVGGSVSNVSVGDLSVDMDVSGVDTVSGAVSGGLCDLNRVPGGGDTDVNGVDTVSGAVSVCMCDLYSVSPGAMVVRVGEMMSEGGNAVVSGVDVPVCGVRSVLTAGELDVCCCGSLVSDETGDVVSVDDVVACGDDPLLPDSVRASGRLSVVGETLACDSGVARVVEETRRWWLSQEWLHLYGWTGSSAWTVHCGTSHLR